MFFPVLVSAQVKFSDDPQKFIPDLKLFMTNTKNEQLVQVANEFEGTFSSMTPDQQKKVVKISQTFQKKKFKANPHYLTFYQAITFAVKAQSIPAAKLDTVLWVTEQVLTDYDQKKTESYLNTIKTFFEMRCLYSSKFNSLRMVGGDYSFGYSGAKTDAGDMADPVDWGAQQENQQQTDETAATGSKDLFSDWDKPAEQIADEQPPVEDDMEMNGELSSAIGGYGYVEPDLPSVTGAFIKITNADLVMVTKNDSTTIKQTSGTLIIDSKMFNGEGGSMDWSVAGLQEVKGTFKKYGFNTKTPYLAAEGFTLEYPSKIDDPVEGVFEFKSQRHKNASDYKYPRFMSYANQVNIKDLGADIKYKGGFSLSGKRIYSSSVDESLSKIEVSLGGILKFKAISNRFEISDTLIAAEIASLVIYQNQDSITHMGVRIDYDRNTHVAKFFRESAAFKNSYFRDTYHKMEINAEYLYWDLNTTKLDFQMLTGRSETPVELKSYEYFDNLDFDRLKGLLPYHPLLMPVKYANRHKVKVFYSDDMAKENKLNPKTVRTSMLDMSRRGLVDYNPQSGKVRITAKGQHFFDSKSGKKDFDNIYMKSIVTNKANASMDISNNELSINGVKEFYLSDTLNVYIRPENDQVKMLKNRDFLFDGKVYAANYIFQGHEYRFNYDSFYVNMQQIDSMKLKIVTPEKDLKGRLVTRELSSQIESTAGILFINKPFNKSAKKYFPEYPIFKSYKGSFVYYDDPRVLGGVYGKDVYFEVPPFTLDSMNSADHNGIKFDGTFHGNGIVPDMVEVLTVMPDLSLGFEHKCPVDGLPVYGDKGKLFNAFTLSNNGIRGNGDLAYLSGRFKSEDFVFYPDSVKSIGNSVNIKEGKLGQAYYPDVVALQFDMHWKVPQDSMIVTNLETPFNMYNNSVHLDGKMFLLPTGLFGEGTLETRGSETVSLNYYFEQGKYTARESIFKVLTEEGGAPALESKNVRLDFNFSEGHAHFSPEIAGSASNEFPAMKYKTSIADGDWDLNKKTVSFHKPDSLDLKTSYFYSTRPEQDSLVFCATYGFYDITNKTLNVRGIPFIIVGDSKVIPDSNRVVIRENAEMDDLKNAHLLIDTLKERYSLHDGNISIRSRKEFVGEAMYTYRNVDSTAFEIRFSDFTYINIKQDPNSKKTRAKDAEWRTHAKGVIRDDDGFRLAPKIFYKGDVFLYAEKPELAFGGYVLLDLKAYQGSGSWLIYNNNGDSSAVKIDVKDIKSIEGDPLIAGLALDNMQQLYSAFLSKKRNADDKEVFIAKDYFNFSNKTNDFTVGDLDRLGGRKLSGNFFSYNDNSRTIRFEGKTKFFDTFKDFDLQASVIGQGNLDSNELDFNSFILLKMTLPENAMNQMATYLNSFGMSNAAAKVISETNKKQIAQKMSDLASEKSAKDFLSANAMENKPLVSFDKSMAKAFCISEVKLRWSEEHKAWYNIGKIGVANVLKNDINFFFDGYLEIKKTTNGDVFSLYLEPMQGNWYFISFESNKLSVLSSDPTFNSMVTAKSKGEQTNGRYYFVTADNLEKSLFVKDYKLNYLGIETADDDELSPVQELAPEEEQMEQKPAEEVAPAEEKLTDEHAEPAEEVAPKKKKKKKKEEVPAEEEGGF